MWIKNVYYLIFILFSEPPVVIAENTSVTLNRGESVRLRCHVKGSPKPEVIWYRNAVPVTNILNVDENKGTTYNLNHVILDDAGLYQCMSSNDIGVDYAVIKVEVKGKFKVTFLPVWMFWFVGCFVVLNAISSRFKLYRGSQFYWWRKQEKTTDLSQVSDKVYIVMLYRVHLAMNRVRTHNCSWMFWNPVTDEQIYIHEEFFFIFFVFKINRGSVNLTKISYIETFNAWTISENNSEWDSIITN